MTCASGLKQVIYQKSVQTMTVFKAVFGQIKVCFSQISKLFQMTVKKNLQQGKSFDQDNNYKLQEATF